MSGVSLSLNGRHIRIEKPAPQQTLLDFVRAEGLTGCKEGCAEGECGACALALVEPRADGSDAGKSEYRVINSCLMFLPMADGREIYTVEALASDGEMCDAQRALAAAGGSQCGYCTPGFVMSLFAEHHRPDRTGPCDIAALAGNLCRCTGYRPIRQAASELAAPAGDRFSERLAQPAPELRGFSVEGFSRPSTLDECLAMLRAKPDAKLIAGGTDLGVESNLRARRWPHLVSLECVEELREFADGPEVVTIGAGLPLSEIGRRWAAAPPVFRDWLELFASPLIRNRATLGGNLATASPIGDAAPLLIACDAVVQLAGVNGRRSIPLSSFFVAYRQTAMQPGEIILSVQIPKPLSPSLRFYKIAKRRLDDISTVAAAMAVDLDERLYVQRARFVLGGVAATTVRVGDAEAATVDQLWNEAAVDRVQRVFQDHIAPMSDHRGSKEYRLAVSKSLVEKYWWEQQP